DLDKGATHLQELSVASEAQLRWIFEQFDIAVVVHCAARSLVSESVSDPVRYYRDNIGGATSLVEVCVRNDTPVVFSSSASVYGAPDTVPIAEDVPLAPTHPYGVTKMVVERLLQDAHAAHGLSSLSLRYFNAAGADEGGRAGERHEPET